MVFSSVLDDLTSLSRQFLGLAAGTAFCISTVQVSANEVSASLDSVKFSNPSLIHQPAGYSHTVDVPAGLRTIYVAGQLGLNPYGKLAGRPGDFDAQARQAFENVKIALESTGASFYDVVKMNMYVTEINAQLPVLRKVRDEYVNIKNPPATTTVEISRLAVPGASFEIEVIAILPAK